MRRCIAVLLLLLPAAASAQATYVVTPFAAVDRSLPGSPVLLGMSGAAYVGNFGLRASGSAAMREYQVTDPSPVFTEEGVLAWAGDLELVLRPGRKAGASGAFGPVDPRVFGGVGVRAERFAGSAFEQHTVVTFGSTLSYSLLSRLRGEVEARRVIPMDQVSGLFEGTAGGAWEYRAGLGVHFGKGPLRPTGGVLDAFPIPGARTGVARRVVDVEPGTVLGTANTYVGSPYVWGGTSPSGFDCSGFVQHVYASHSVQLPRTSREMALVGERVPGPVSELKPGDLMFFAENRDGRITHVGIYSGSNMMIHSSKSGGGVGYDDLTTERGRWFQGIYVGARRVLGVEIEAVAVESRPGPGGALGSGRIGHGAGIAAFLAAAGMSDLSDLARTLYAPNETPDAPDNAPARRW